MRRLCATRGVRAHFFAYLVVTGAAVSLRLRHARELVRIEVTLRILCVIHIAIRAATTLRGGGPVSFHASWLVAAGGSCSRVGCAARKGVGWGSLSVASIHPTTKNKQENSSCHLGRVEHVEVIIALRLRLALKCQLFLCELRWPELHCREGHH